MALKHYGGSLPSAGPLEWSCPSCGHQNAVPLKAGCQQCGQKDGAGARKVEENPPPQIRPDFTPIDGFPPPSVHATRATVEIAVLAWMHARDFPEAQVTPWANSEEMQEAFMAGVAWAQGQQGSPAGPPLSHTEEILDRRLLGDVPNAGAASLYLAEAGQVPVVLDFKDPATQTILAALAFYRDNVLNYGAVPGQLDAQGVTDLVMRLSPEEAGQ